MHLFEFSVDDPPANLAVDEALLMEAERDSAGDRPEVLRLWQFSRPVVVLGRSSRLSVEANVDYCQRAGIPILRRCSGGAAVVGGPGCLMYSVVLDLRRRPELRMLDRMHHWVMERLVAATGVDDGAVQHRGTCDVVRGTRKFSGNALRVVRDHTLYHGTILYDADLKLIARALGTPPRQPDYREGRSHADFVGNLPIPLDVLQSRLAVAFGATATRRPVAPEETAQLAEDRYRQSAWTERHL